MCDCYGAGHGTWVTDWAQGDVVCTRCGVVVEGHIIDESPEWTHRAGEADKSRVGMASTDLGTYIDTKRRKLRDASWTPKERARREGLDLVNSFLALMSLSTSGGIAATAREIFVDFDDAKGVRSDTRRHAAAAAVYFACKMENAGRELRLVASVCDIDQKQFNAVTAEFKDALKYKPYHDLMHQALHPSKLLDVFLDRLRLPTADRKRVWKCATQLTNDLQGLMDCGRKPRTLCAGIVWTSLQRQGIDVPKKTVSEACAVCQQTLDKVAALITDTLKNVVDKV